MTEPSTALAIPGLSQADIQRAQLPALYIAARSALEACVRVDECKNLQDKYTALARYAKQSKNQDLLKLVRKIALRAERRMGELIRTIPKYNIKGQGRAAVGRAVGISQTVMYRALTISDVPKKDFEAAVESDNPPSRGPYAETVRKKIPLRPQHKRRKAMTTMKYFVKYWQANPPETLKDCFTDPADNAEARELLGKCAECIRVFAHILTEKQE